MRRTPALSRLSWAVLLTTAAACNCNTRPISKASGDPQFTAGMAGKNATVSSQGRAITIDFGFTLVNQETPNTRTFDLTNDGVASVTVLSLIKGTAFDSDAFKLPTSTQVDVSVQAGGSLPITVSFAPTAAMVYTSTFTLKTDADQTNQTALTVTLTGTGVSNGCVLTPTTELNFGNVLNNTSYTEPLVIQNTTPIDWTFTNQGVIGADAALFTLDLPLGVTTIKANTSLTVNVTYTANHPGTASAQFQFQSQAGMCMPEPYSLVGNGVSSLLTEAPAPVDFGYVDPGVAWGTVTQVATITNIGNAPLTITGATSGFICSGSWSGSDAMCTPTSEFADNADGTISDPSSISFTLAPNMPQTLTLYFKPALLHTASGLVQFDVDGNAAQPSWGFNLTGVGGGPILQAQPSPLNFGEVAIGAPQDRNLVLSNVGSSGMTPSSQLQITSITIDQTGSAFSIDSSFDLATQVYANPFPAAARVAVPVKFNPTVAGQTTATLHILSNDPSHPDTAVPLNADGEQLPPCNYTVSPSQLNFGNVAPGSSGILTFRIANTNPASGNETCLISNLDLTSTTANPPFSLVGGPIATQTLAAGGHLDVQVKFAPVANATALTGSVVFFTSSTSAPTGTVNLSGTAGNGCLLIAPDDLNFGVVQVGCASRQQTVTIYNVCSSAESITGIVMQPDISGNCPGAGCPFVVSQGPSVPTSLAQGSTITFVVTYTPPAVETDATSLAVQTAGTDGPYLVTLEGSGALNAVQTDEYHQDAQPKVDLLMVVDDSGSMETKQNELITNFNSFIAFAESESIDYHIAVTTTSTAVADSSIDCSSTNGDISMGTVGPCGKFVPADGSRPRIITPQTGGGDPMQIATLFGENVAVGDEGSGTEVGFEAAYEALTPPNINGWNAGFLRDDANLAILVVTDSSASGPNAGPQSFDFYQNFFLSIKGFTQTNAFTFNAICATQPNPPPTSWLCDYDPTHDLPNPYVTMANNTNGLAIEVCTNDWATNLRQLGQSAFGYRTRFFLSESPDTNDAITVQIDGVNFPATTAQGTVQWTYNATANAIDFSPLAVPQPGSTLTISYNVLCYPP